ncbi:MAG TPA: ATP-binding cassette domain-containing protein [Rhizomicrobium sp.]|nr:ATP-binding cassette domain-containing protein [Rhizomicrobium sp.]
MIKIVDVTKLYPGTAAPSVRGLSLEIDGGDFLVLIGPSGCGKTTTLGMINRLVEPSAGRVEIEGLPPAASDPVILRRHIGYVFQEAGLFPHMTVAENIAITPRLLGWPKAETQARVSELLALVRLAQAGFALRLPRELSGGQRQRVALARALAARPAIMLLDEPFGALDPLTRDEIAEDYRRIHETLGLTTVMVTHDMTEALLLADRIGVMREGRLVQIGTPRQLLEAPADGFVAAMIDTPKRRARRLAEALHLS